MRWILFIYLVGIVPLLTACDSSPQTDTQNDLSAGAGNSTFPPESMSSTLPDQGPNTGTGEDSNGTSTNQTNTPNPSIPVSPDPTDSMNDHEMDHMQIAGDQGSMNTGDSSGDEGTGDANTGGEYTGGEYTGGELVDPSPVEDAMHCDPSWIMLNHDALKDTLYTHVRDQYAPITPQPDRGGALNRYTTARALMFSNIERRLFESSEGVFTIYLNRFIALQGDEEPDHSEVNCEHTWPRSRLAAEDSPLFIHQESDLHHLFPAVSQVNSLRGSYPFGEPVTVTERDFRPAVLGIDEAGTTVFSPINLSKGNIARVIFYMSLRWGLEITSDEEENLRRWHEADPVELWEITRNDRIEQLQGNRNPFVDCPELVERIQRFDSNQRVEQLSVP